MKIDKAIDKVNILLVTLLLIIQLILEVFTTNPEKNPNNGCKDEYKQSSKLEAAYACFETTEKEATRESVKRKMKILSLKYHPDRNGGSEESTKKMQEVNEFYAVLQEEFGRREGKNEANSVKSPSNQNDCDEEVEELDEILRMYPKEEDLPKGKSHRAKTIRKNWRIAAKKSKYFQRKKEEEKMREEEISKRMKEMERSRKEERKRMKEMERSRKEERKRMEEAKLSAKGEKQKFAKAVAGLQGSISHGRALKSMENLYSDLGRKKAYDEWQAACGRRRNSSIPEVNVTSNPRNGSCNNDNGRTPSDFHDIDADDDEVTTDNFEDANDTNSFDESSKPINRMMDACTSDITVALKLEKFELAVDILFDRIEKTQQRSFSDYMYRCYLGSIKVDPNKINETIAEGIKTFLLAKQDEDGNTLMHYAVYFESRSFIDALLDLGRSIGIYHQIILAENHYNHKPIEYCRWGYTRDPEISRRMEELTAEAIEAARLPTPLDILKNMQNSILHFVNVPSIFGSVCCFITVRRGFGSNIFMSLVVCYVGRFVTPDLLKENEISSYELRAYLCVILLELFWALCFKIVTFVFSLLSWSFLGYVMLTFILMSIMFCLKGSSSNLNKFN